MLKGDRVFNSFFITKQIEPKCKTFKKSTTIHLGIFIVAIKPQRNLQIEWWEAQSDCRINKDLVEKSKMAREFDDFVAAPLPFDVGVMFRVS